MIEGIVIDILMKMAYTIVIIVIIVIIVLYSRHGASLKRHLYYYKLHHRYKQ